MIRDPIVEEVHRIRKRIWEECGGDYDKLVARWRAAQAEHRDRLVSEPPPKRRPVSDK